MVNYDAVMENSISAVNRGPNIVCRAIDCLNRVIRINPIVRDIFTKEKIKGMSILQIIDNEFKELNSIFQDSYDGISIVDMNGIVTRINKAFERVTGLKMEKVVGVNLYQVQKKGVYFNPDVALKVLETGKPVTIFHKSFNGKEVMAIGNLFLAT